MSEVLKVYVRMIIRQEFSSYLFIMTISKIF